MAERWGPLTGVAFVALLVISFIVAGDTPDTDEPAREILAYYNENDSEQIVSAIIGALAVVFFLFFNGRLRRVLRAAEGPAGGLSATAFAGGILIAVGGSIFSAIGFTLGETAEDMGPEAAQTLHLMNDSFFFPLAIGVVTFTIAAGGSAIRTGALPAWLGWAALVIGIAALTPIGFFAFLASLLWVLVTSVLLALRAPEEAAAGPG